jgi:hypothetical protein
MLGGTTSDRLNYLPDPNSILISPISTFPWTWDWLGRWAGSERAHCTGEVFVLSKTGRPARRWRLLFDAAGRSKFRRQGRLQTACAGAVALRERACPALPSPHTGHFSSFQAISQNIHSYFELMRNACSMRFFSSCPAVRAQVSTRARIHSCTASNSGEA